MLVTICTLTGILVDSNLLYLQFDDYAAKVSLGPYCGSEKFSVQSSANFLYIIFQSDFKSDRPEQYSGFVLRWKSKFHLLL